MRRRKKETVRTVRFPPGSQSTLNLERIVANDGKQGRNQLMGDKLALVQQYINVEDSVPLKQFTAENNVAYGTFYGWLQVYKRCKGI